MNPIPTTETLERYINQIGIGPGNRKLELFRLALRLRATPPLHSQEGARDPMVYVKLFDPAGAWTWFLTEWDTANLAFGFVVGSTPEFGYVDLRELSETGGPLGIGNEIDVWFCPKPLSRAREELRGSD